MPRHHSSDLKHRAEELRSKGKTYTQITSTLGVPKSTLSLWLGEKLGGIFDKKAQAKHLAKIRVLAIEAKKRKKIEEHAALAERVEKEIATYPLGDIGFRKSILAALYWAEGAKYEGVCGLRFVNTDPRLMKFFIVLLRGCYRIDPSKLRVRLFVHYYHRIKVVKKFWSSLLDIPLSQFNKEHKKKRSKTKRFRKNYMGICVLDYLDSSVRKEIMELGYRLGAAIRE